MPPFMPCFCIVFLRLNFRGNLQLSKYLKIDGKWQKKSIFKYFFRDFCPSDGAYFCPVSLFLLSAPRGPESIETQLLVCVMSTKSTMVYLRIFSTFFLNFLFSTFFQLLFFLLFLFFGNGLIAGR